MKKIGIYDKQCIVCKNNFQLNPRYGIKYSEKTGRGKFCSRDCYYKWRKGIRVSVDTEFKKGQPKSDNWYKSIKKWTDSKYFKTGRWAYRQFIKSKCEICEDSSKKLYIHHKDENNLNNNIINLQTVCSKCHTTVCHPRRFYGNQYTKA